MFILFVYHCSYKQAVQEIIIEKSFVKNNHIAFMINCNKNIDWLRYEICRYNGLRINFFIDFPFDLVIQEVNVYIYAWICTLNYWSSTTSPLKSRLILVVNMTVIKMKCNWTAWNESFLELLSLGGYADYNTVMNRLNNFEGNFTFLIWRQLLQSSNRMPRILRTDL